MRKFVYSEQTFRRSHESVAAPAVNSGITHAKTKSCRASASHEKTQS